MGSSVVAWADALVAREAVYVVDARDPAGFAGAHVAGSFAIGLGPSFGVWVGSVVPDDRPLLLVLPGGEEGASPALAGAWQAAVRQLLGRPGELWGAASSLDELIVIRTLDDAS